MGKEFYKYEDYNENFGCEAIEIKVIPIIDILYTRYRCKNKVVVQEK